MSTAAHDSRPQKRPRPSDDSSPQTSDNGTTLVSPGPSDLRRHSEDLWLDDGNVILAAKNSAFRVLRSLLASQSTVFADMFSSSRSDAAEIFDGCPVVHVSDAPEDVAHFLRALLPTSERVLFACAFTFSFHQLSAIIRLAHKYNVQVILDQATAALQQDFTPDFDVWEGTAESVVDVGPQQNIGVINLARLVDRPSILPSAFYRCALLGSSIVDGYKHEDRSVEYLSQEDVRRCIDGQSRLVEESFAILLEVFIPTPCDACETLPSCEAALQWMLREAIDSTRKSSARVLERWDDWIRAAAQESHLCAPCQAAAIKREYRARRRVWNALPDIFNLTVDGWPSGASGGEEGAAVAAAP